MMIDLKIVFKDFQQDKKMPSQIKVDEIKNVAGQYKIKTNVFEGQTTAGSIAVQGEGTATTNLQQGLAKCWCHSDNTSTPSIDDTFNVGSITDNGKADLSWNWTNSMTSAHDMFTAGGTW